MDILRRFREGDNGSGANTPVTTTSSSSGGLAGIRPTGLTVDTSVLRDYNSKSKTFENGKASSPQWMKSSNQESRTPSPTHSLSLKTAPTPTRGEEDEERQFIRRKRSNSECLFLAKSRGPHDLPGPCQEYISSIKQILARHDSGQCNGSHPLNHGNNNHNHNHGHPEGLGNLRRRSMSLKNSSPMKEPSPEMK